MTVASIVPFDTLALRAWAELEGQPPLDPRELEKLWAQLISDLLAAADWIDEVLAA